MFEQYSTMKIFLYARYVQKDYLASLKTVLSSVSEYGWKACASENLYEFAEKHDLAKGLELIKDHDMLKKSKANFAFTLGGDGTILGATCIIKDLGIPIMGINHGRLGFLAGVERKNIKAAMKKIAEGQYIIEERTMLCLESEPSIFGDLNFALNDFTIHKRDTSSMVSIHTYINGDYLNSYWADGLIVATPTGSTGYSLSCGGPIVFPNSGNMVITPVAPHNLNVRPLVISDSSVISFSIEGRAKNFLSTLDSRYETITPKHQLAVRRCDFNTRLVILNGQSFFNTIHEKLSWGADKRN